MEYEDLLIFLEESGIHQFYPVYFKGKTKESSTVDISGGTVTRGGVNRINVGIVTRDTHPTVAVNKAKEIRDYMKQHLKGAFFNGIKIINIETMTPEPLYIGEEDSLYMVSFNYEFIQG